MKQPAIKWKPSAKINHQPSGFTLIELLVTISIAAVLLTVAIPSFQTLLLNNRMTSQTNGLVLALTYAKSEAIKRGVRVVTCNRDTNTACGAAASTNWDNGWLVFVDNDNSGTINGADLVLQVRSALDGSNTLRFASNRVPFESTGFSPNGAGTFNLCDSRGTGQGRSVIVSAQGRVSTQTGAVACP